MPALNAQQIAALLQQQGVAKEKIPTMTAIALAESSGRPQAFNPNAQTGDRSYGLFQVNMHGGLGPARMKQFGLRSEKDLFNPETNVKAAKQILESQGLSAWSVYKGGQYKQFLPEAQKAVSSLSGFTSPPAATAPAQAGPNVVYNIYAQPQQQQTPTTEDFLRDFASTYKQQAASNLFNPAVLSKSLVAAATAPTEFGL